MAKKSKETNPYTGRWRIIPMRAWDEDYINEEEEGYFEFDDKGWGVFHFGYVQGQMDCRLTTRDGEPAVEWTWEGNDEIYPAQGRGWAVVPHLKELHIDVSFRRNYRRSGHPQRQDDTRLHRFSRSRLASWSR